MMEGSPLIGLILLRRVNRTKQILELNHCPREIAGEWGCSKPARPAN